MNQFKQLYKEWKSLQPLRPEDQKRLDDKFRLEFNYNSNHLEGNTLTYGQTKLLLMFDQTEGSHELREYEEMRAHDVALHLIIEEAKDNRPLTENLIRTLNKIILVRPFWKDAETSEGEKTRIEVKIGEYKSRPNHVRTATNEIFHYADVAETPVMMKELVDWYNSEAEKEELSPIELATLLHYRFIRIHPFEDGNGRIARLLVNFVLTRFNCPFIVIKTSDKENYLRTLHRCDAEVGLEPYKGANAAIRQIQPFVDYMERQMKWSFEIAIKAAKGEDIEEPNDWEKKLSLLKTEKGINKPVVKKTKEAIDRIFNEVIDPFYLYYKDKMGSFDSLFLKSDSSFYIDGVIVPLKEEMSFSDEVYSVSFYSQYMGLREPYNENYSFSTTPIFLHFHLNAYSIEYSRNVISKLYTEDLSKEEMDRIISFIASDILKEIETKTKK